MSPQGAAELSHLCVPWQPYQGHKLSSNATLAVPTGHTEPLCAPRVRNFYLPRPYGETFPQRCEDLEGRRKPSASQADLVWVTLYILAHRLLHAVGRPRAVQPQPLSPDVINQKNCQLLLVLAITT